MHIPSSTYRVQLNQDFSFEQLKNIIDYLDELGISTVYAAPIGKATPGSSHGYDVTDPNRINPEVGKKRDMRELYELMKQRGMNWIQDIVPNHMAFHPDNARLMDVLERGPASPYYRYFDINWNHHDADIHGKLMVPFLGKHLAECIQAQEIKLAFTGDGFTVTYYDTSYPLSVSALETLAGHFGNDPDALSAIRSLQDAAARSVDIKEWHERKRTAISALHGNGETLERIEGALGRINQDEEQLDQLLDQQHYKLVHWKETERRLNYRRFFTINSLICLRMEDDAVFDEYHKLIRKMYADGWIHGVRIDHIDGLMNPSRYLERLREVMGEECYIIAEKILEADEKLPAHWPIQGTSGYEFLSAVNKLLTDTNGSAKLVSFYNSLVPGVLPYDELVLKSKSLILTRHMAGELDNLVQLFTELSLDRMIPGGKLKETIAAFMLAFPVYRIYPSSLPLSGHELHVADAAVDKAIAIHPELKESLEAFRSIFTLNGDTGTVANALSFIQRLMQFTGPLTAKGVEDTTFYVYNPLISHDEVGDAPDVLGTPIREFHKKMLQRVTDNPMALNATATHDTKRGEDARIRLNLLSELPDTWAAKVTEWIDVNESAKTRLESRNAPARNDEYFIYQSIVGGFPEDMVVSEEWVQRLKEYIVKVVREGKVHSGWEDPNEQYENACATFIDTILSTGSRFLDSFIPFMQDLLPRAMEYSLCQAVLKITSPGIPDIYQGCELWDLSYVDPDNRRPVDYEKRKEMLAQLRTAFQQDFSVTKKILLDREHEGSMKLFTIWRLLQNRREHNDVLIAGAYIPLAMIGEGRRVLAYARYLRESWCLIVVPVGARKNETIRLDLEQNFISLPANSPRVWRNIFTNEVMEVSDGSLSIPRLLQDFPVAVLCNE